MAVWLTPPQTAERIGYKVETLRNWRYRGTGPAFVKVGTRIRYDEAAVTAWQTEQERA